MKTPVLTTADMSPFSPALVLTYVVQHEPVTFTEDSHSGLVRADEAPITVRTWDGPFPFEHALGLLFYGLVSIHRDASNVTRVVATSRGEAFSRNQWDDPEIVDACRRLRMEARGSMVVT